MGKQLFPPSESFPFERSHAGQLAWFPPWAGQLTEWDGDLRRRGRPCAFQKDKLERKVIHRLYFPPVEKLCILSSDATQLSSILKDYCNRSSSLHNSKRFSSSNRGHGARHDPIYIIFLKKFISDNRRKTLFYSFNKNCSRKSPRSVSP